MEAPPGVPQDDMPNSTSPLGSARRVPGGEGAAATTFGLSLAQQAVTTSSIVVAVEQNAVDWVEEGGAEAGKMCGKAEDNSPGSSSESVGRRPHSALISPSPFQVDIAQSVLSPAVLTTTAIIDLWLRLLRYTAISSIAVTIVFTLRPISVPCKFRGWRFPLDMRTVPVFLVILLLILGEPVEVVWQAVLGTPQLCPLQVMAVFFGMAYLCLSLDRTGLLRMTAVRLASRARGPKSVFLTVTILTILMTLFISNDILVLTLTPVIVHLSKEKGFDPYPFLFLEFVAANVWSISLVIGNTTNLIVAGAAGVGFTDYVSIMGPPGVTAGLACTVGIYLLFYRKLSNQCGDRELARHSAQDQQDPSSPPFTIAERTSSGQERLHVNHMRRGLFYLLRLASLLLFAALEGVHGVPLWVSASATCLASLLLDSIADFLDFDGARGSTLAVMANMPWEVLPFVLSLFFLVEVLDRTGTVALIAHVLYAISGTGQAGALFVTGFVTLIACQFLNSQPMTVLFTKVLTHPDYAVSPEARLGAMYALIIASNFGANLTKAGALCGPMYFECVRRHGLEMTNWQFSKVMLCVTPAVMVIALGTLSLRLSL